MAQIEIYTQHFCPYCARAMNFFNKRGIEFKEIPAPAGSAERAEAKQRSGGRTSVPQIFIDGTHVGGSDDLLAMDRDGRLAKLLEA
jgi:glutaredoxin 3